MEIIQGKYAGFCYGVSRAINTAYDLASAQSSQNKNEIGNLCTLGAIVHNKEVTKDLEKLGIRIINSLDEAMDEKIIIRSHGVPPEIYDELKSRNLSFVDCTCPSVKKIHNTVLQNSQEGRSIIIVGNADHPEIEAIKGYAKEEAVIIENEEQLQEAVFDKNKKYALVVQTTFNINKFEKLIEGINKNELDIKIFNTICQATADRQEEAENISKKVDVMLIIGDESSSNTAKLVEICQRNCPKTFLIETIKDLQLNNFNTNVRIGITAGASTPPAIIKEAFFTMSELENTASDQTFEEMLNESFVTLRTGDVVKGTVIQISNGEVSVNLGYKSDGVVPKAEFSDDPTVDPADTLKPGDDIEVFVVRVNDGEGNVLLSKKKIDSKRNMDEIETAFHNKTTLNGKIVDVVKGGLIAIISGVRVFVPSSQISNRFVENLLQFKGKEFMFDIIEFDKNKRRIVAGRKALATREENQNREKVFAQLEVGHQIEGSVSRIVDFGAFVDLGGVDGLVHISELSWGRVKKVTDVLSLGDKVVVTILDIDKEKGRVSLSLKDVKNNPWNAVVETYPVGSIVEGKVVRMAPFGAFVELEEGVDGLIHISQISEKHVVKPEDELKIGDIVRVKVTEVDIENNRISLSKKEAEGISVEGDQSEEATAPEIPAEETLAEEAPLNEEPTNVE